MGNILQETDGQGNLLATYIYANGQRIARVRGNEIIYYHNDVLGSPALLMNDQGEVVHLYHFGPFGNIEAAKGTSGNKYRFTGKEQDETGLYYFGARYYDPMIGRWLTPDPVMGSDPRNLSPYWYCYANPLIYIDPTGEWVWLIPIIAGAVIGGVAGGYYALREEKNILIGIGLGMVIGAFAGATFGAGIAAQQGLIAGWTALGLATGSGAAAGYLYGGAVHGAWTGTEALKYTLAGAGIGLSIGAYFAVPKMIAAGGITKTTYQVVSAISYGTAGGFYGAWYAEEKWDMPWWIGAIGGFVAGAMCGYFFGGVFYSDPTPVTLHPRASLPVNVCCLLPFYGQPYSVAFFVSGIWWAVYLGIVTTVQ
jgi:RHS repeat-associated protein